MHVNMHAYMRACTYVSKTIRMHACMHNCTLVRLCRTTRDFFIDHPSVTNVTCQSSDWCLHSPTPISPSVVHALRSLTFRLLLIADRGKHVTCAYLVQSLVTLWELRP